MIVPSVPSGQYYLRVEPEMETGSPYVRYELELRRNVPNYGFFGLAALLLLDSAGLDHVSKRQF